MNKELWKEPKGYPIKCILFNKHAWCKVSALGVSKVPETDFIYAEPIEFDKLCETLPTDEDRQRWKVLLSKRDIDVINKM